MVTIHINFKHLMFFSPLFNHHWHSLTPAGQYQHASAAWGHDTSSHMRAWAACFMWTEVKSFVNIMEGLGISRLKMWCGNELEPRQRSVSQGSCRVKLGSLTHTHANSLPCQSSLPPGWHFFSLRIVHETIKRFLRFYFFLWVLYKEWKKIHL